MLAHVAGGEAERLDLLQRRLPELGPRPHQREDGPELARVAGVLGAEAGVEQDEPVVGLDQQAVADDPALLEQAALAVDQPRPVGAQRPAVEVVDRASPRAVYTRRAGDAQDVAAFVYRWRGAGVAELAYAIDSKSIALTGLWVRVPPPASRRALGERVRRAAAGRRSSGGAPAP